MQLFTFITFIVLSDSGQSLQPNLLYVSTFNVLFWSHQDDPDEGWSSATQDQAM